MILLYVTVWSPPHYSAEPPNLLVQERMEQRASLVLQSRESERRERGMGARPAPRDAAGSGELVDGVGASLVPVSFPPCFILSTTY